MGRAVKNTEPHLVVCPDVQPCKPHSRASSEVLLQMLNNVLLPQGILSKAGKPSVLGSMDENDPDAADDEDEEAEQDADEEHEQQNGHESSSVIDSLSNALQKTGLIGK